MARRDDSSRGLVDFEYPPGSDHSSPRTPITGAYAELELSDKSSDFDSIARESLSVRLEPSPRTAPRAMIYDELATMESYEEEPIQRAAAPHHHTSPVPTRPPRKAKPEGAPKPAPLMRRQTVSEIRASSKGPADFIPKLVDYMVDSGPLVFWIVLWIGLFILPIVMVIMGIAFNDDCALEPNIPTYLIVSGIFTIALLSLVIFQQFRLRKTRLQRPPPKKTKLMLIITCIIGLLILFLVAWLIAGCVWVYDAFENVIHHAPGDDDYCSLGLYRFSVAIVTLQLSAVIFGIIILVFVIIYSSMSKK